MTARYKNGRLFEPEEVAPREPELEDGNPPAYVRCADNADFIRELPDCSMKLIVTSPPYNLGKPGTDSRDATGDHV